MSLPTFNDRLHSKLFSNLSTFLKTYFKKIQGIVSKTIKIHESEIFIVCWYSYKGDAYIFMFICPATVLTVQHTQLPKMLSIISFGYPTKPTENQCFSCLQVNTQHTCTVFPQ